MARWLSYPPDKLLYQYHQQEFLAARRLRKCATCKTDYSNPPDQFCPTCKEVGLRKFDRLTIIAGRRFGKSMIGSVAAVEEACIPNTLGWACAPTVPKLHRYVIPAFQKLIPKEWVLSWNSEFLDLRLRNQALIHFQTLEDPDQGRGQGLNWLFIDEVCELTLAHWNVIRPSLIDKRGVAFFTTSPRGYDWTWETLYKPAQDGVPGYWAAHAPTAANPTISLDELERERQQMPEQMFRQEYLADFVTFQGAVYGDLLLPQILHHDDQIRKIIPEWPEIAGWRQVLVGIDTGADHPFGAVKIISTERGLVVVDEYLERHKSFTEHKAAMVRMAKSSTAKWAINRNERQPIIELAQPPNQIYCQPAENDVVAGTERVKTWLHSHQLWFIEHLVPKTVQQMKAYRWAENTSPKDGSARKERVYKKEDELPDCVRYALMTWPQLPKTLPPALERDLSKFPAEQRAVMERMRRIDLDLGKPKEPDSAVEDFYL